MPSYVNGLLLSHRDGSVGKVGGTSGVLADCPNTAMEIKLFELKNETMTTRATTRC